MEVCWRAFPPVCWWFLPVPVLVLITVEQVQDGARSARQSLEILDPGRVRINTADATEGSLQRADPGVAGVEAGSTATKAAEEMEVTDLGRDHSGAPVGAGSIPRSDTTSITRRPSGNTMWERKADSNESMPISIAVT